MEANDNIERAFAREANEEGRIPFDSAVFQRMFEHSGIEVSQNRLAEAMESHDREPMLLPDFEAFVKEVSEPGEEEVDGDEDTKLLRVITNRFETKVFPAVELTELSVEQVSLATAAIDLVKNTDHERIQAYIDSKFAEYSDILPDEEASEPLVKARWARVTYYHLVKEMVTMMAAEASAFVPEVSPEELEPPAQHEATSILRKLLPQRVPTFLDMVSLNWSKAVVVFPPLMQTETYQQSEKGKAVKKWMHKNYYLLMKECVSTSDSSSSSHKDMTNIQAESFTFKPDLRMDELSVAEKEKARFVYPRVTEDIARKIDEEVRNQSKQALSILPHTASTKLWEKTYRQWLHARYVQIVSDCVEVGASPPLFEFVPQVAVESLSEEAQRSRAQELVQAVGAKDVCHIEEAIRRRRTEWEAKMPQWMILVSEEIWKEQLHGEYYDIIDSILSKKRDSGNVKKDDGDRKEKRSSEMVAPPNAMAFSPGKRIRSQSSSTPMEYLEACEIHLREQCIGEEYAFEGYLLYAPETIKTVELPDYKTHAKKRHLAHVSFGRSLCTSVMQVLG